MPTTSADFDHIYNKYFTPLYRYLFCQTKSKETAEDLVQTVFLKVLKNFPPNSFPSLPYFFAIARNTVIDHWKKRKETVLDISAAPFAKLTDEKADPQIFLNQEFSIKEINEAMKILSFEQKEALTLRFINDLSNSEIAKLLGKNEEAVRQIQYRALKRLREIIKIYE